MNMKYIITERQFKLLNEGISPFILRRVEDIDNFVNDAITETDPDDYNLDEYVDEIVYTVVDKFGQNISPEKVNELEEYILKKYSNEIEEYYDSYDEFDFDDFDD